MENNSQNFQKKDLIFAVAVGFLIGLLAMPVLRAAKPDLYEKFYLTLIPFFLIGTPFGVAIAHIISKKIAIIWQISKFGVIGVLNTFVDLGILTLLTFIVRKYLQIDSVDIIWQTPIIVITFYSIYKAISFIIANINSYFCNKYWTFEQNLEKKSGKEFFQFFTVSIIGFLINFFIASFVFKSVTPIAGMNVDQWGLIGALAGTAAGLVWNFLGYKFIVFKKIG